MPFKLHHWNDPRGTIANKYKNDDLAYGIHGGHMALQVLEALDLNVSELDNLTVLDYGCGTGRIARVLAPFVKRIVGYDPNKKCIAVGLKECQGMELPNLTLTSSFSKVPECNIAFSVNVLEHLEYDDAKIAIQNILNKCQWAVIYWSRVTNLQVMKDMFGEDQVNEAIKFDGAIQVTKIKGCL